MFQKMKTYFWEQQATMKWKTTAYCQCQDSIKKKEKKTLRNNKAQLQTRVIMFPSKVSLSQN